MIRQLRADEARYGENIDPKTGAIHRPTVTDPDPYNQPDPLEPQPQRYEPPAAVAQGPRHPIGFRPNVQSTPSAQVPGTDQPLCTAPNHETRNTNHQSRLTVPSTPGRVARTRRTQSRRSYLESMGWHRVPAAAPLDAALSSRGALVGLKPVAGMTLGETHTPSY